MIYSKYLVSGLLLLFALNAHGDQKEEKRKVAEIGADGIQRVEVIGGDYYFDPNYIVVKNNVPVELTVRKEPGLIPHNIIIKAPEAGIEFNDSMGTKPKIIRFTPTKVGKYVIECDKKILFFKSHKEKGMEGTLEVVE